MLINILILNVLAFTESFVHHKTVRDELEKLEGPVSRNRTSLHVDGCPEKHVCTLPIQCPAHVRIATLTKCSLAGGRRGLCCGTGQNHTVSDAQKRFRESDPSFDFKTLQEIFELTQRETNKLRSRDYDLMESRKPTRGYPSSGHFKNKRVYGVDLGKVKNVADRALTIALATKAIKEKDHVREDFEWEPIRTDLTGTPFSTSCTQQPFCPTVLSPYRTVDGSCNNLKVKSWGMGMTPFARLLPPKYRDGVWTPRVSEFDGGPLKSPRAVSVAVFDDEDVPNLDYSMMLMQFGQFLSHDLTHSIDFSFPDGSAITCCGEKDSYVLPPEDRHHACMPIEVPDTDNFFSPYGVGCMNFVRSLPASRHDCSLGFTQQMNKVTHYIDASAVYGSTEDQYARLRSFDGGRLRAFNDFGRDLLPLAAEKESCRTMDQGSACFESGDPRTNQMITLVAVHTLFMREHNRVAGVLRGLNPHWDDERLFLEARRILIAELQVIVYGEFLPCVLGDVAVEEFELNLTPGGYYSYAYDEDVEPSVTNEFSTAAFRFGHSIVNGILTIYGKKKIEEMINIPEVMFYPSRMRMTEFYDEILSTLTSEPIQQVDNSISEALTKYMFRAGNPFGVDLASINIQRGRDHGLRSYNDYRILVGLPPARRFEDFGPIGEKLRRVYTSVDDVDLWVGGLVEEKAPGSILGPTFRDIVADQFSRLKRGDRYFFENEPRVNPGYFTLEQLGELKKVTMARIICDNSDGILLKRQALNAFKVPSSDRNPYKSCDSEEIPSLNYLYWKEI